MEMYRVHEPAVRTMWAKSEIEETTGLNCGMVYNSFIFRHFISSKIVVLMEVHKSVTKILP